MDAGSSNDEKSARDAYLKRTIQICDVLSRIDPTRVLYPRGLLTKIGEPTEKNDTVKRIELFARKRKDSYGIIRSFHVAYSSERSLLEMAEASNNVISVRSIESSNNGKSETKKMIEDRLVLKRVDVDLTTSGKKHQILFRPRTPDICVSPVWLEKMKLRLGARLLVSNPIENYAVLPPSVS